MKKKKKYIIKNGEIDDDILFNKCKTVEERLEYFFSDIDFTSMKKALSHRPKRHRPSAEEVKENIDKFLKDTS